MDEATPLELEERVLLLAPTHRDATQTRQLFAEVGVHCTPCRNVDELRADINRGVGAVVLTEHGCAMPEISGLVEFLRDQPPWSDLPVVVLVSGGGSSVMGRRAMEAFGNVTVLERPVHMASLASVVKTLIRSRRRQYQIRQHIREREQVADELGQSEARYRSLAERQRLIFQNIIDYAIYTIDPKGIVTEWTEGAERVKGWKAEEILGQSFSAFYTPELIASGAVEAEIKEATETGRAEREDWRVRKGGELFWGNEIATAMRDASGKLLGFTKVTRDLTERRRMEESLREAEERHRLIVENARDFAIMMFDAEGHVLTWNTGAERIFGYTESEIRGQDAAILFIPEDRAAGEHQKELATAVANGRASDDRWQMRRGGERFFASGVTTPLRDSRGTLRGFVKICRDLTEQQRLKQQRERLLEQEKVARLEAERAMTMRDEFLAIVSHELRTPLTAILLWSKMLGGSGVKWIDQQEVYDTIRRNAEAQQQLIEDLLDISRMISGKLSLNVAEADLAAIVQAAVDTLRPMAEAKGVDVKILIEADAGSIRADPGRIQQVIWNLLNNGVKFTDSGGQVTARLWRTNQSVIIEVRDTGRGISPEFLPYVFERFRQADSTSTRLQGGLGLGLAISRQLVELHGGSIRAESDGIGKGSTFVVELPVGSIRSDGDTPESSATATKTGSRFVPTPVLTGLRVLVVEDEADTRSVLQWLFEQCEADVTAVSSAAQAVAAFREGLNQRRYDVLVSDIGMPIQNGYELMQELREMERQRGETAVAPAVALTAYAREEDRARAKAAGFQMHVSKPVEPAKIVHAVATLAGRTYDGIGS